MSEQNEEQKEMQNEISAPKDPRRLTDIDWSKDTPRTAKEWVTLSPVEQLDWSIWHEIKLQHTFATIAILLEIALAIVAIVMMDCSTGMSVLIGVGSFILTVVTGVFSAVLYRALRAAVGGGLIGFVVNVILLATMSEGTLRMVLIVLGYVGSLVLMGSMEAKGALSRKIPYFPGPKEPGLIDDMKKMHKEWKKWAAKRPKKSNGGFANWFNNTVDGLSHAGVLNTDLHKYKKL